MANPSLDGATQRKILELRRQGRTERQIGKALGLSHGVVGKYMHLAPLIPPRDRKSVV